MTHQTIYARLCAVRDELDALHQVPSAASARIYIKQIEAGTQSFLFERWTADLEAVAENARAKRQELGNG